MSTGVPREKTVFCEALEISDPEERRRFLDQACGTDRELREQVDKLLEVSQPAGDFFEECAPALKPAAGDAEQALSAAEGALQPEVPETKAIGRYKLLQKLGEGGYGVVYMAEQEQPIRRRVALKIIKLGMDTRNVIARFEAERQALALMDHPNIARVLDAGATENGRPYFVMELVYGVKITDYCDQNRVSMRERLELFIQICNAVQHAHQKGIIHRDLKPSNIMVTMHDGVPVPKVIDFGIAKATEQRLTDKTLFTSYAQLLGTPAYMSPEQMELSGLNLDTRSDIYSLGILLYELLTGRTPFDTSDLLKMGVEELRRTVCERDPLSPSAKLQTLNNDELTKTARMRRIEAPRLLSQVRGDLDWIVLKCLEKDRTRRYATANGLAMDIDRYLQEEAVFARPPSRLYQLQKLARRNRLAFLSSAAVLAVLLLGIVFTIRDAARARRSAEVQRVLRERAEESQRAVEQAKAEADAANQRLRQTLFMREWQDAEQSLEQGKVGASLAWFAKVVRTHPHDMVARTRLLSILTERSFALPLGRALVHGAAVDGAVLTHDGTHLITSAADERVRIWSLDSQSSPLFLPADFTKPAVAVVSPGDRVLVRDLDSISVWDLGGKQLAKILVHRPPPNDGGLVKASPDGRFILLAEPTGWQVWDANELRPIGLPVLVEKPHALSRNGQRLFGFERTTIGAWDTSTGKRIWTAKLDDLPGVSEPMFGALDEQDERFVVDCWPGTAGTSQLSIWNLDASGLPPGLRPSKVLWGRSRISALTFSPNGQRLFVGDLEGNVGWADPNAPEGVLETSNCEHAARITSVNCGRDGRTLATASADGTARVWDVRMGTPNPRIFTNAVATWDAKFSPDSRWFVMGGLGGAEIRETTTGLLGHRLVLKGLLTHLNISPDGRRVVACADSGQCCVWDAQSGRPMIDPVQTTPSHYTAFSPDGRLFCVVTSKSTTHVFETESGRPAMPVMTNRHMGVSATFTRDLHRLVVATDSGEVEFWSIPQGVRMESDVRHKDVVWTSAFSPDQRLLLTASGDRTAALWETATGRFVHEFRHEQQVLTAAFSPDGQRIITGDTTRHAFIWDAATGKLLARLMQHPGSVWHAEFSAAGDIILTGDDTGNARLWDGTTGLPLSGWVKNGPSLKRAHLSPDGRWALSAAEPGTVRVWPVLYASRPAPQWLPDLAEALAGRRLGRDDTLEPVPPERLVALKKSVGAGATDDFYTRWASWFFVERMNKTPLAFVP